MSPQQLDIYRQRLQHLAQRHSDGMSRLQDEALHGLGGESGGGISNAPTHMADLGNAHHQGEIDLILMENEEQLLAETNAALDRIATGTYGLCEGCSRAIPDGRLDAFPYARYCVPCSRKLEAEGVPLTPE